MYNLPKAYTRTRISLFGCANFSLGLQVQLIVQPMMEVGQNKPDGWGELGL